MSTSGLMQSKLTLQETYIVRDLMNRQKSNLLLISMSSINFQFSYNFAVFLDILNYTRHNGGLGTAKTPNSRV